MALSATYILPAGLQWLSTRHRVQLCCSIFHKYLPDPSLCSVSPRSISSTHALARLHLGKRNPPPASKAATAGLLDLSIRLGLLLFRVDTTTPTILQHSLGIGFFPLDGNSHQSLIFYTACRSLTSLFFLPTSPPDKGHYYPFTVLSPHRVGFFSKFLLLTNTKKTSLNNLHLRSFFLPAIHSP